MKLFYSFLFKLLLYHYVLSNGYYLTVDRVEPVHIEPEYIILNQLTVDKYNRTTQVINWNMDLLKEVGSEGNMEVKTYALFSNEYRAVPLVIKRNVCSFFEYEYKFFEEEVDKCSNCKFPSSCPIQKGNYYLKNFIPNGDKLPASIPWRKVMFEISFNIKKTLLIYQIKAYLTFDRDAKLANKYGKG